MALSSTEAEFVRRMILHGNKLWAVRSAFPKLEKGFEDAAIRYMMQNPEVTRHIDAGVLYMFRQIVKHTDIPVPQPLTVQDKMDMLRLIINGERETPTYIVTAEGLRVIFVEPMEDEIDDSRKMLKELQRAEELEWMM
ncbi:MAG: hypothetical protein H6550_13855 [Chitinophagales bacterium]|nr:hypothetical protein [Chitinophagales bacterium]